MLKIKTFNKLFFLVIICIFGILLMMNPEICSDGVRRSILLCGRILIPSLFPFSVCVLYIIKSGITERLGFLQPFTKIFGLTPSCFLIMIFSMLGGYPIGAKLINEQISYGNLTEENGRKMLNFCVNAGPGFIVMAVGNGLLQNKKLGFILLISHIISSFVICLLSGKIKNEEKNKNKKISPADNFVLSAGESAGAVISICGFVILFGVITSYIEYYSQYFYVLKPLIYICEVTSAVTKTDNIYLIAFLLGFSGICIWCQILSVGKAIKINITNFIFYRLLHGILSSVFTFIILKIYPVSLPTFSNTNSISQSAFVSGKALGISLVILAIVFIISITNRPKNIKILEELI